MKSSKGSAGIVFEIRECCVHDGPGVRTTLFLKGCPLRCAWCHNPEGISPKPEVLIKPNKCIHCGNCQKVCPSPGQCIACGECAKGCPAGARQLCGTRYQVDALCQILSQNRDFFLSFGGGITFSGGEPLLQAEFVQAVAQRLHPIHLAIETSGYADETKYQRVIKEMDLVFQDLKHPYPKEHIRFTGVDPSPIFRNLAWLKTSGVPFIARIPLIPGVNDTAETFAAFAELLQNSPNLLHVELLPYHITAGAKYPFVGREYQPPFDVYAKPNTDITPFTSRGIACRVM